MSKRFALLFVAIFSIRTLTAQADNGRAPLDQRVVEHTCGNGIKLLILERHFSPTVAVRMIFRTGSVDEISGKTGLAHMFEHMMFKGTKTLGTKNYAAEAPLLKQIDDLYRTLDGEKQRGAKADQTRISALIDQVHALEQQANTYVAENELWNLYEREGASDLNAHTSPDYTGYDLNLPSNKIKLWALVDSDRVRNPVFRQFYSEREVVKEERRMRVDTEPEGKLYENFLAAAFIAHPYHHPTIGWESDLDHLSVADLQDFYKRFYTPDQLTIAVVGDVKTDEIIGLVDQYFGTWQTPKLERSVITVEPPQDGPRHVVVKFAAQPRVVLGYHINTYPDPDFPVTYALAYLLGNGTTSRLYKALVEKKKLATSVETSKDYPGERYNTLFIIDATPRSPHTPDEVAKAIREELDRLQKEPILDWEVEKIRAGVDVGILNTLQTNEGMASTLAYDQAILGDWHYILDFQKRIKTLTAKDLKDAAKKIFVPNNETMGVLESTAKNPAQTAAMGGGHAFRDGH